MVFIHVMVVFNTCYISYTNKYSVRVRADTGMYACQHGATAAANHFPRKFSPKVTKTTVHSIKRAYLQGVREKKAATDDDDTLKDLPLKKRGRPVLYGEALDSKVQTYLRKVREGGGVVTARIVIAAAKGIVLSCDWLILAKFGGHVRLNRHWAYSLLTCMKFVRQKVTTNKSKHSVADFVKLKKDFLRAVASTVEME